MSVEREKKIEVKADGAKERETGKKKEKIWEKLLYYVFEMICARIVASSIAHKKNDLRDCYYV